MVGCGLGSPASKLTVADHRCSVLKGMRCLVEAPLSSSGKAEVAGEVAKILAVHIKQEGVVKSAPLDAGLYSMYVCVCVCVLVHLGTSVVAVNVLVAFCELLEDCRLTIDFIKVGAADMFYSVSSFLFLSDRNLWQARPHPHL